MTKLGWDSCQEFQWLQIYTLRGLVSGDLCRIKSWWFCAAFCRRHSEKLKSWPALSSLPRIPSWRGSRCAKERLLKSHKRVFLISLPKVRCYDAMMPRMILFLKMFEWTALCLIQSQQSMMLQQRRVMWRSFVLSYKVTTLWSPCSPSSSPTWPPTCPPTCPPPWWVKYVHMPFNKVRWLR